MEVQLTRRPAARCCHQLLLSSSCSPSAGITRLRPLTAARRGGARQKSTTSRTKRALNIPPHPSFLSPTNTSTSAGNHIIFNPPSAAPSVYHTPFKFLPKSDPRRRANLPATLFASSTTIKYSNNSNGSSPLPSAPEELDKVLPVVRPDHPKKYHLTQADVDEMRRLRAADPVTNSVTALATRFSCSKLFVMMCCHASREHKERMNEAMAQVRSRWGPRKTAAFNDANRRWQMLLNGEL